uniref:Sepiapterin reductase n=1 Tax=Mola mola TaxID=94237 RepID=A0A3Q3X8E5_MOLML
MLIESWATFLNPQNIFGDLKQSCVCIITGSSRGFGRALAHELSYPLVSCLLKPGSVLLLVGRSEALLQQVKEELQGAGEEQRLVAHCIAADLSTADGLNQTVEVDDLIRSSPPFSHQPISPCPFLLPASLGDISQCASFTDLDEINSYPSLDVSSALTLTAGILVVNVSSVFAAEALSNWVLYCTSKAAGKMMFCVLAAEEPNIRVLSPTDTEMQEDILRLTGIRRCLIPCQESAAKLVALLLDNDFPSGTHLDFFTA